jgi:hypothetical protein
VCPGGGEYTLNLRAFERTGLVEFKGHRGTLDPTEGVMWARLVVAFVERAVARGPVKSAAEGDRRTPAEALVDLFTELDIEHPELRRHFGRRAKGVTFGERGEEATLAANDGRDEFDSAGPAGDDADAQPEPTYAFVFILVAAALAVFLLHRRAR